MPEIIPYFMEQAQIFQILALVFIGILPLLWNLILRQKIDKWNDQAGLIEFYRGLHESLGYLSWHHKIVSSVLVSIGLFFALLAILVT